MLISTKHKHVIMKLRDPTRVMTVIPTAKIFTFQGVDLVAVPHKIDETKVLNNLGIATPSPMLTQYAFPCGDPSRTPFEAQRGTGDVATLNDRLFILNDMGTGKTLGTLWAWDFLRQERMRHKLLVAAPLSALERAWVDEIVWNFPHLTCAVLHGTKAKRLKLLNQDVDIYIVNHDGVEVIEEALADRKDIDHVVVDELAEYRNATTDKWKALDRVVNHQVPRCAWGLTGRPTPLAPTDAWAEIKLIRPKGAPKYFGAFRDMTMKKISTYKWVAKSDAMEQVYNMMQPAVRYTRDECVDLPPAMFVTRHAELTTEQARAYKSMTTKLHAEFDSGQVLAVNEGVKRSKLLQIAVGAIYTADQQVIEIPVGPRLEVIKEVIAEAEAKVIVFVPLTGGLNLVERELSKYWSCAVVDGSVSKSKRDDIFNRFQRCDDPHVLVANPGCMAHALTLVRANTIIWFAPTDNDTFEQANHRIIRPGQKHNQFIVMIEGTEVERRCYQRLAAQQSLQGVLLEMFGGQRMAA